MKKKLIKYWKRYRKHTKRSDLDTEEEQPIWKLRKLSSGDKGDYHI